jgi:hypothetical protein
MNTHFPKDLEISSQRIDTVSQGKAEKGANDSYRHDLSTGEGIMKIGQSVPEISCYIRRNSNRQTTSLKLLSGLNGLIGVENFCSQKNLP